MWRNLGRRTQVKVFMETLGFKFAQDRDLFQAWCTKLEAAGWQFERTASQWRRKYRDEDAEVILRMMEHVRSGLSTTKAAQMAVGEMRQTKLVFSGEEASNGELTYGQMVDFLLQNPDHLAFNSRDVERRQPIGYKPGEGIMIMVAPASYKMYAPFDKALARRFIVERPVKYVNWLDAWQAFQEGKRIKPKDRPAIYQLGKNHNYFTPTEMLGEWEILD